LAHRDETHPEPPAAASPFGKTPLRAFALAVALPTLLFYLAVGITIIGVLTMMAQEMDRIEDRRGLTSIHAALDTFLSDLAGSVSDEGTWDEAYLNVVVHPDPAWMDTTWGATARLGQSYDTVLITDQVGTIIFGENNAGALKGDINQYFPASHTMLAALDKGISQTGDATTVVNFAGDSAGAMGLTAISIHKSEPGQMNVPRESRRVLWIARHLTAGILQDIASRYQTPLASVVATPQVDDSAIEIADADGKVVGTLAWTPDRPGDAAFNRALLIAMIVYFVIGAALVGGLGMLRRAMLKRALAMARVVEPTTAVNTKGGAMTERSEHASAQQLDTTDAGLSEIEGISSAAFDIAYQPIFDVRAEALIAVEALLRWRKPNGETLLLEKLSPMGRAILLERVGLLALRRAADEIAPLIGLTLIVEIAPPQMRSEVFAEKTLGTLSATNFPVTRLQVAADCATLVDLDKVRPVVNLLRQAGVTIALRDYSLSAQTIATTDTTFAARVCMGPATVHGLGQSPARHRLVAASIEAARAAGLAVTITGADDKDDVAHLLRLGVREFEGNLFAGPMPIAALTQLILAPPVRKAG
jgi:EAL domain-containing protein (putative c-di-GMP-specific phosphodiesterase class I)